MGNIVGWDIIDKVSWFEVLAGYVKGLDKSLIIFGFHYLLTWTEWILTESKQRPTILLIIEQVTLTLKLPVDWFLEIVGEGSSLLYEEDI